MKKLYLSICTFFTIVAFCQSYDFTVYNPSNSNIVSNSISSLSTDTNGLLWISSYNGVSSFNGTAFTNYTTTNSAIPTNAIVKIVVDSANRKWMATQLNGVTMFNGTTWANFTTANGLPSNNIADIAVDTGNNIWVATDMGLSRFNGSSWTTFIQSNSGIHWNVVNSVAADATGNVWLTSGNVLQRLNGSTFTYINDGAQKILKIKGDIVYTDQFDGLTTYNIGGDFIFTSWMNNSCLSDCSLQALDTDENNKIWIGFHGVCGNGGLQNLTGCNTYTPENSGMPDHQVEAVKVISSDFIWVGTQENGLVKMTRTVTADPMTPAPNPTLPQSQVLSMFSGVYTNVPVDTWKTSWSPAALADVQIVGNDTKKYTDLFYVAVETAVSPMNVTDMTHFNMDVWSPDFSVFKIKLIDLGANGVFGGDDDVEHELQYDVASQRSQWLTYHIPLTAFTNLVTRGHIGQIYFASDNAKVFVDNVYFSTEVPLATHDFGMANKMKVYPNPMADVINISFEKDITNVSIINVFGQEVATKKPNTKVTSVDVSNLSSGIYIVKVEADHQIKTLKIIKQ